MERKKHLVKFQSTPKDFERMKEWVFFPRWKNNTVFLFAIWDFGDSFVGLLKSCNHQIKWVEIIAFITRKETFKNKKILSSESHQEFSIQVKRDTRFVGACCMVHKIRFSSHVNRSLIIAQLTRIAVKKKSDFYFLTNSKLWFFLSLFKFIFNSICTTTTTIIP